MSDPLQRPGKKNPMMKTAEALLPPQPRSLAAFGLTRAAAEGRFVLQCCADCGHVTYPARDACPECLSDDLPFAEVARGGDLLAETLIEISGDPFFRGRPPMRQGLVLSDTGARIVTLLHRDCAPHGRVRLSLKLDRGGQPVVFAHPETGGGPHMEDDPAWRDLTAQPKFRRILISDGRHPVALPLTRALFAAGAEAVFIGVPERWKPFDGKALQEAGATLWDLDPRDEASVRELAADLGGKTDIVIHCPWHFRPAGLWRPGAVLRTKDALEAGPLGLARLAQAFGPAMAGRGGDGPRSAVAWVNLMGIWAHAARPDWAAHSAAQAAELSLSQALRAELARGGVRVINAFAGALEDDWFEALPPPKLAPAALAQGILRGLQDGVEDLWIGAEAEDFRERLARNPKEAERLQRGDGQ